MAGGLPSASIISPIAPSSSNPDAARERYRLYNAWWTTGPDQPGDFQAHFQRLKVIAGRAYIVVRRCSERDKQKKWSLLAQKRRLVEYIESRGGIAVTERRCEFDGEDRVEDFAYKCSGRGDRWREKFYHVNMAALEHDAAAIVMPTPCRWARHPDFHTHYPDRRVLRAREIDLIELRRATGCVPLMTYIDPDTGTEDCIKELKKWAEEERVFYGLPTGRKPKGVYERKRRWLPRAQVLRAEGHSLSRIVQIVEQEAGERVFCRKMLTDRLRELEE